MFVHCRYSFKYIPYLFSHQILCEDPKKPHLWDDIVSYSSFSIADVHLRFSLAEFLTKLIYSYGSSLLDRLIEFAESIENLIMMAHSERETSEIDDRNVKGTIAIAILVYLKQTCDNSGNVRALCSISVAQLERLCIILLKLLGSLEKLSAVSDPLVQDACCSGLCFCYQLAGRLEFEISKTASVKANAPIQKLIANTVIYTLTRDKKLPQPPGMAPAGASGENRSDRDSDTSAANNLLQGASAETQDPLAAAAAEAAARIGLSAVDLNALRNAERNASVEQAMGGMRSDRVAASEGDFGVYTKACKVAKKSGDPSVVFSVLTLIRRNPAVIGSAILYDVYWPRLARIDPSKRQSLLPMLYVSKFDPSPPVKAVMKDLWNRLIPAGEMPGLLSTYAGSIIRYAISQTTSGAWRDRECGCLALESFIGNKSWNDIFPFLDDLWNSAMQVLDDIRESTRSAAIGFAKVLSQQIMRACSPDINPSLASSNGSNDSDEISSAAVNTRDKKRKRDDGIIADLETTTAVVIPILLDKGLVAQSQEGRGFSLGLLVQVVKVSKQSLKEHLIRIIDILIESMAALEPRTLQYMQFHTARLNISDKDLEDLRLSLSQNSPMQEALDICLEALPANYLPSVIYQLGGHLRGGVGLATRVSAVKSLVRLMENSNPEFKKNDGALARIVFEACLSVLLQFDITSVGLKSSMLGCLSAAASCILGDYLSTQCVKLVERYSSQFSTSFEATETLVIAQCLGSIIRKAGEQLEHDSEVWSSILCCSYIGSFHPDIDVSKAWMITWNESLNCSGCGNKYSALLKVLPSVTIQICELLRSLSWVQRTVGLAVIRDVTNSLPFDIIKVYTFDLIVSLLSCIKFRIWTGQALVLETLAIILEKNKSMYSAESWDNNGVVKVPVGSVSDTNIATSNIDGSMKADDDSVTYQYVAFDSIVRIRHESEKTVEEMMFEINRCAVIDLFLAEAVRGDKLYRYSAAKALAEMHESWVYLSKYCPAIAMQYLSTLCMLSG